MYILFYVLEGPCHDPIINTAGDCRFINVKFWYLPKADYRCVVYNTYGAQLVNGNHLQVLLHNLLIYKKERKYKFHHYDNM